MSPELCVSFFIFFHSVMDFISSILLLCILGGKPKAMWAKHWAFNFKLQLHLSILLSTRCFRVFVDY